MSLKKIPDRIKQNKLINDSLWSLVGNVLGKGLALVAGIFIARLLGKDLFGEYGIVRNTILTIGVFSTFGLGYTATKFIADYKVNHPQKIKLFINHANQITLIFSGLMAILLFFFADIVASRVLEINSLGNALRILSVLIVFNAIATTQVGILAGLGLFKQLAKINAFVGILTFFLSIFLTYLWGLEGALIALVLVQVVNCSYNYLVVRNGVPKDIIYIKNDKALYKEIVSFSFPIALQECSYAVASWVTSVLLIRLGNVGDLGMYTAAMQWNAIILFIPGILRNVVLSHLAGNKNNVVQHRSILKQTLQINFLATLLPCIIVFIAIPLIVNSYGTSFIGLGSLISIAVFSTLFTSLSNVYAQAFTSIGKNWLMFMIRLMRDVLIIVLFVILIKYFNYSGDKALVYSNLFFSAFFLLIMFITYKKINYAKFN